MLFYSHINEDNNVERQLCHRIKPGTLVCITGSGERLISLLDTPGLEKVFAVDVNPEAQFLLELKMAALKRLDTDNYLDFIGFRDSKKDRARTFDQVAGLLGSEARHFWEGNMPFIRMGILNAGHFERFVGRLRPVTKKYLGRRFDRVFEMKLSDCRGFPHGRWKMFLKLLSSKYFFKLAGNKDIAFTAPDCDHSVIASALNKTLIHEEAGRSFIFHLLFKGHLHEMAPDDLPPSLKQEVLRKIQERLAGERPELVYVNSDLRGALQKNTIKVTQNTFFSMSDILSFEEPSYVGDIIRQLQASGHKGLGGVFRTFLRNEINQEVFASIVDTELEDLSSMDRSNMYKVYHFSL